MSLPSWNWRKLPQIRFSGTTEQEHSSGFSPWWSKPEIWLVSYLCNSFHNKFSQFLSNVNLWIYYVFLLCVQLKGMTTIYRKILIWLRVILFMISLEPSRETSQRTATQIWIEYTKGWNKTHLSAINDDCDNCAHKSKYWFEKETPFYLFILI